MNTLQQINNLPLTKHDQQDFAEKAINEILSGNINPVTIDLRLKSFTDVIKKIREDKRVKEYTIEEAEKFGKSFKHEGVSITLSARTTRDFSGCGDPIYNDMAQQIETLKAQMKAREAMLLTGVNPETGETYQPPRTETTTFLTYKF